MGLRELQTLPFTDVLAHLDTAVRMADVNLPGYRLHALKGELREAGA
jgi:hypothetical protein